MKKPQWLQPILVFFRNLKIKFKLNLISFLVALFSLIIFSTALTILMRKSLEKDVKNELRNINDTMVYMIKTSIDVSIRSHLKGIADRNLEIVENFYNQFKQRKINETLAKQAVKNILDQQSIGETGYTYILNLSDYPQAVRLDLHPLLEGPNVSSYDFVRKAAETKTGYIEYMWKNPGEPDPRPKAMYFTYFQPWKWLIGVSAYRKEFRSLVQIQDFEQKIKSIRIRKSGYVFLVNQEGKVFIHPGSEEVIILSKNPLFKNMLKNKTGMLSYKWKNPLEKKPRLKMACFSYLKDLNWYVVATAYHEELFGPIDNIWKIMAVIAVISLLLSFPISLWMSRYITHPLNKLVRAFNRGAEGNFDTRVHISSGDELGALENNFNWFMEKLEDYDLKLRQEMEERRQIQEIIQKNAQKLTTILETTNEGYMELDNNGHIVSLNPRMAEILGYSRDFILGKPLFRFVDEDNLPTLKYEMRLRDQKIQSSYELEFLHSDGSRVSCFISATPLLNDEGEKVGAFGMVSDISDRIKWEKKLSHSLREKEVLLREVHHRVKNNLQVIYGLLMMQAETTENSKAAQILRESMNRVQTMALIHKNLYETEEGFEQIHVYDYLKNLVSNIFSSYEKNLQNIDFEIDVDKSLTFPVDMVGPCGLIVNELVTNSIKYAFQGLKKGTIRVHLSMDEKKDVHLQVRDNGKGLPEGFSLQKTDALGLELVRILAGQLMGKLQVRNEKGAVFDIRFHLEENVEY
jgi:PAS domain S-box-containing protein